MTQRSYKGIQICLFDSVDSTMDQAQALAKSGFRGIVMASEQTAGRGTGPKQWHSPRGGLYFTWVMDYDYNSPLTEFGEVLMHMAAVRTLRALGVADAKVHAPNKLYVSGYKIGGSLKWDFPFGMLLGFGLNLDLPGGSVNGIATSVKAVTGFAPEPGDTLDLFINHVQAIMSGFPGQLDALKQEWAAVQLTLPDTDQIDRFLF
jgi:BirA family biotin operon repressor/biotin-[acetyl-CoA-carboxylase] ligase